MLETSFSLKKKIWIFFVCLFNILFFVVFVIKNQINPTLALEYLSSLYETIFNGVYRQNLTNCIPRTNQILTQKNHTNNFVYEKKKKYEKKKRFFNHFLVLFQYSSYISIPTHDEQQYTKNIQLKLTANWFSIYLLIWTLEILFWAEKKMTCILFSFIDSNYLDDKIDIRNKF